ncbi:hypothetical protein NDU88_002241 [Pleurodeles waltl]|uniref:Uncharacterized protein n=1 Tax=Pleurodeles waltl TaxID=8319 RepID=A0AAV7KRK7_PLEWA|nr:hypothetical protein NDU88_002241 [Pleurodeles waltl]
MDTAAGKDSLSDATGGSISSELDSSNTADEPSTVTLMKHYERKMKSTAIKKPGESQDRSPVAQTLQWDYSAKRQVYPEEVRQSGTSAQDRAQQESTDGGEPMLNLIHSLIRQLQEKVHNESCSVRMDN